MLDLIILVVLLAGIGVGAKRGFIVQMMHIVSFVVALIVAYIYYKPLAQKFVFWVPYPGVTDTGSLGVVIDSLDLDRTFYRVIAFAVIFFAVKITTASFVLSSEGLCTFISRIRSSTIEATSRIWPMDSEPTILYV